MIEWKISKVSLGLDRLPLSPQDIFVIESHVLREGVSKKKTIGGASYAPIVYLAHLWFEKWAICKGKNAEEMK
jgi:hypothetical protein